MTKDEAIAKADWFYSETGQHAHVVSVDGDFEWYCTSYFDNGTDREMIVVYNTWDAKD